MSASPLRKDSLLYDGRTADITWLVIALLILVGSVGIVTYSYNHDGTVMANNVPIPAQPSGLPMPAMNFVRL